MPNVLTGASAFASLGETEASVGEEHGSGVS